MNEKQFNSLFRYTNLAATIHLLRTKKITLLNPATWDDKNDAYFMAEYKRRKELTSLLALCFSNSVETYHHWRVFSHGSDGTRIEFSRAKLLKAFEGRAGVKHRSVRYRKLLAKNENLSVDDLPFLKRWPYKDESEYRIIYSNKSSGDEAKDFSISINCVKRITISPWLTRALAQSISDTIKGIDGCGGIPIAHSTLIRNDRWQALASNLE